MSDTSIIDELKSRIASIESSAPPVAAAPRKTTVDRGDSATSDSDLDSADAALSKIVALVNATDKSERAIRKRLLKSGFSESAIDESVWRAKSYGFIDDTRFADVLIRSRISQGKGMSGIERELRAHDIDVYDVPGWPDDYQLGDGAEFDRALAYLRRKPPRSKNLRDGAYRKLVGKGYCSSVAASAARVWAEQLEQY